ncbi:MAG TPA: hypothetical protein VIL30_16835 [Ramlibacter sp.]
MFSAVVGYAQAEEDSQKIGMFLLPSSMPDTIMLVEDITEAAPLDFHRAIKARPEADKLVILSGGGSVYGALAVALEVHERGMSTIIPENAWCYSACAYIFFAGRDRQAVGELGVHQIASDGEADLAGAQMTIADILEALNTFDVDPGVITIMFRTPARDIYVFSDEQIRDLGIERSGTSTAAALALSAGATQTSPKPATEMIDAPKLMDVPSISPHGTEPVTGGVPENITRLAKTPREARLTTSMKSITIPQQAALDIVLLQNGFTVPMTHAIETVLGEQDTFDMGILPADTKIDVLLGPSSTGSSLIPYRVSFYTPAIGQPEHAVTVALNDKGYYVLSPEPAKLGSSITADDEQVGKQERARRN